MNPQEQVCHNPQCWVYGRAGEGHIVSHSLELPRFRGQFHVRPLIGRCPSPFILHR
jgi:hypothetical protein